VDGGEYCVDSEESLEVEAIERLGVRVLLSLREDALGILVFD
jgi:hypothetical protein